MNLQWTGKPRIAGIVHHNRDRTIVDQLSPEDHRLLGDALTDSERKDLLQAYDMAWALLSPRDETRIRVESIYQYLDITAETVAESTKFIYTFDAVRKAMKVELTGRRIEFPDATTKWLRGRGVSASQQAKWELTPCESIREPIAAGVAVHPFLRKWIGQTIPVGVCCPCYNYFGFRVGAHNRFLSTVPKMKFSSALPGGHIHTNRHLLDASKTQSIYVCEGIFDAMAAEEAFNGLVVTPSSGYLTAEQLFQLATILYDRPDAPVWWCFDHDRVGFKTSLALQAAFRRGRILDWPKGHKDLSEAVYRGKLASPAELPRGEAHARYSAIPYKAIIDYDHYLDHRQAAYSNDNYDWVS